MKRTLFFLFYLILLAGTTAAQDLKFRVSSFEKDVLDLSAQNDPRAQDDGDGNKYAIVKVTSDLEDDDLNQFKFEFNMKCDYREIRDGVLWLFVQKNARKVTIRREKYKTLTYNFNALEAGATYRMELSVTAPTIIQRVLQFKITDKEGQIIAPEQPILKVKPADTQEDYEDWYLDEFGTANDLKPLGMYTYEVSAPNYKTENGQVSLVNGEGVYIENVKLTPNFGYLEITDESGISGAEVLIDNRKVGTVPYRSRMECREGYRLTIRNGELYKPYNTTFDITQGHTTKLSPRLSSNSANITINVDGNAEIYVNKVKRGNGNWSGPLKPGIYDIECRLESHVATKKQITVKINEAQTINMEKPKPIEGSLYVSSSPSGAQVFIDDKNVGKTPNLFDHVLIGKRKVTIKLPNYKTEEKIVEVRQGQRERVEIKLSNVAMMTINTTPPGAELYIDGEHMGTTPYKEEMPSGDHNIKLVKKNYHTFDKMVHLDGSNPEHTFNLPRQYQQKNQFYLQPTAEVGMYMGAGINIGGYIHNVNIETGYMYGLSKETMYWNYNGTNDYTPKQENIHSMYISGKVGYGVTLGTRWRITPQLGAGYLRVKGDLSKGYVMTGSLGVKTDFAITSHFGLALIPEYRLALKKSDSYKQLSNTSSKIKNWGQGFNASIGFNIYF